MALKNLPLNFFNDEPTKKFFSLYKKNDKLPNKNETPVWLLNEFEKMQENLINILNKNKSKFAFTVDAWSSKSNKSYYGITIHYINNDWELISTALDFIPSEGNHAGVDIAQIFYKVTEFYQVTYKIAGITLDNVSANTTFIEELGKILKFKGIDIDIDDIHFRCLAHILNLGVQDMLSLIKIDIEKPKLDEFDIEEEADELTDDTGTEDDEFSLIVKKIRKLNIKIRNSERLTNKLKSCCNVAECMYKKPETDSKTRWNSTFTMLEVDLEMKEALNTLCEKNESLQMFKLSPKEWYFIETIVDFLKDFKRVTDIVGGEKYVTLPDCIIAINVLFDEIEKVCFELDLKDNRTTADEQLITAFQVGRDKMLKHYKKFNWIYCVGLILDPRVKSTGLKNSTWGLELLEPAVQKLNSLYKEYAQKLSDKITPLQPPEKKRKIEKKTATGKKKSNLNFNVCYVKSSHDDNADGGGDNHSDKLNSGEKEESEIEQYLNYPQCKPNIDLLQWWKNHQNEYPILAAIARDILCVPATSVPVERLFSEAAHILTKLRCSLGDEKFRALICTNMWMKSFLKRQICEVDL